MRNHPLISPHSRLTDLPPGNSTRCAVLAAVLTGHHALVEIHADGHCSFRGAWPTRTDALAHAPALLRPDSRFEIHPDRGGAQ